MILPSIYSFHLSIHPSEFNASESNSSKSDAIHRLCKAHTLAHSLALTHYLSLFSRSLSDSPTLPPVSASPEQDAHSRRICFHAWWGLTRSCSFLTRVPASSPALFSSYDPSLGIGRQDAKVPLAAGEAPSSALPGGSCALPGIHKLLYSV